MAPRPPAAATAPTTQPPRPGSHGVTCGRDRIAEYGRLRAARTGWPPGLRTSGYGPAPVGGRAGARDRELVWGGPGHGGEGGELEPVRQGPPQWLRAAELDRAQAHRLRPAEVVAPDLGHPAQAGR